MLADALDIKGCHVEDNAIVTVGRHYLTEDGKHVFPIRIAEAQQVEVARDERVFRDDADRVAQLELSAQLAVAQLDVAKQQPLPRALKAVQLHALPTVLMIPAENKEPPVPLFDGSARPKELLYFAQRHASHAFALPPNPHLTREQHDAGKEQVGRLPEDKVARAYKTLYEETGLLKDEVKYPFCLQWEQYKLARSALAHLPTDGSAEVLGAIGCVGGIFALVAVAGLALGGLALAQPAAPRGPARVGIALCALGLATAAVVALCVL